MELNVKREALVVTTVEWALVNGHNVGHGHLPEVIVTDSDFEKDGGERAALLRG